MLPPFIGLLSHVLCIFVDMNFGVKFLCY